MQEFQILQEYSWISLNWFLCRVKDRELMIFILHMNTCFASTECSKDSFFPPPGFICDTFVLSSAPTVCVIILGYMFCFFATCFFMQRTFLSLSYHSVLGSEVRSCDTPTNTFLRVNFYIWFSCVHIYFSEVCQYLDDGDYINSVSCS